MTNKLDNGLLPCPFCGAIPTIKPQEGSKIYGVVCGNEPCDKSGLLVAFADRGNGLSDAITAWNTRAQPQNVEGEQPLNYSRALMNIEFEAFEDGFIVLKSEEGWHFKVSIPDGLSHPKQEPDKAAQQFWEDIDDEFPDALDNGRKQLADIAKNKPEPSGDVNGKLLEALKLFIVKRDHLNEHPLSFSAREDYKYAWTDVFKHADTIVAILTAQQTAGDGELLEAYKRTLEYLKSIKRAVSTEGDTHAIRGFSGMAIDAAERAITRAEQKGGE